MERSILLITGKHLYINDAKEILENKLNEIVILKEVQRDVIYSRLIVREYIEDNIVIYGLNTGFGKFSETIIPKDKIEELQLNLIRSHACGTGDYLSKDIVKLAMALRITSLAKGYSGIEIETFEMLVELFNKNIIPVVPSQGSLGASGDLAPLAHIALALIGEGYVWEGDEIVETKKVLEKHYIKPVTLKGKEGLALINGTQISLAILLKAFIKAENIMKVADVVTAMSLEANMGTPDAFDKDIHKLKAHNGQIQTAENIRRIIEGSKLVLKYSQGGRVQDAYSLRCTPQVHGASRDAISFIRSIIETEISSVTDNPLVFKNKILSGGNFHAQHLGIAADTLKIALAEFGSISERRIERLLNPNLTDLNPFMANNPGVESGFMIAQYTAASLVSENKSLCHPATVDSIPVSGNQEDHCSMAPIAARKALEIAENIEKILAIELLITAQAIEKRGIDKACENTRNIVKLIRNHVKTLDKDRVLFEDIEKIRKLVSNGKIMKTTEETLIIS